MRRRVAIMCSALSVAVTGASPILGSTANAHGAPTFPKTIHAAPMHLKAYDSGGALKPGTPVRADEIGVRASLSRRMVAGLADRGALFGSVYPALSTDGGTRWRVNGPRFYRAAANGPDVTDHIAVLGHRTVIAWGRSGNFIKATTDRGKHWYAADFPGGVRSAGVRARHMVARALGDQNSHGRFPTRRYTSADGRRWHRGPRLPSVKY